MESVRLLMERNGGIRSMIPTRISSYANTNLDTILKATNHVLVAMAACNACLLLTSFSAFKLPNMGFNSILLSLLSCIQNFSIWALLNNVTLPSRNVPISATPIMFGAVLGITIGIGLMMLMLSIYFGQLSHCSQVENPIMQYECSRKGTMWSMWFFAGLLFWLNVILTVFLLKGRDELESEQLSQQYQDIGMDVDEVRTKPRS